LFLDYSKNLITHETLIALEALAEKSGLHHAIDALFTGKKVNTTENRSALHTALRDPTPINMMSQPNNYNTAIHKTLLKMQNIVEDIHGGRWLGITNEPITDIVNIGIGGSDLGPHMVCRALQAYRIKQVNIHFVSNIDGTALNDVLQRLDPAKTLFIVATKSFSTEETLINAASAKKWLLATLGQDAILTKHFIAISANTKKALAFGIDENNILPMWDFIGGRFSLWSAIGLSIALFIGFDHFRELLQGANAMDIHFKTAEFSHNMPVIMALISIWYNNIYHAHTHAVLVYDERLSLFPSYLQQLVMESNGKSVDIAGKPLSYPTGEVLFGGVGTNGQHAYHQLLHQGTHLIPIDFILAKSSAHPYPNHHNHLIANCLAQSEALMRGLSEQELIKTMTENGLPLEQAEFLAKHQKIPGNRPSNTLLIDEINPYALGTLIALYEHKTFAQSVIWNINAFDQWGVELGKRLTKPIISAMGGSASSIKNPSTAGLINKISKRN